MAEDEIDDNIEVRFNSIKNVPILITDSTIMLVQLFHSEGTTLQTLWLHEHVDPYARADVAAQQFIDALGDHWNGAFWIALRKSITKLLKDHDQEHGSKWLAGSE